MIDPELFYKFYMLKKHVSTPIVKIIAKKYFRNIQELFRQCKDSPFLSGFF